MENKKQKLRMVNLCFRTEPSLIDLFYEHCRNNNLTRSEGFREIFKEHMFRNFLNKHPNEVDPLAEQHAEK